MGAADVKAAVRYGVPRRKFPIIRLASKYTSPNL